MYLGYIHNTLIIPHSSAPTLTPYKSIYKFSSQRKKRKEKKSRKKSPFEKPHPKKKKPTDPLLYDRLVRRFQSAAEREQEGRRRGYTGVLEADLYRSEAKLAALRQQQRPSKSGRSNNNSNNNGNGINRSAAGTSSSSSYHSNGQILEEDEDEDEDEEEEEDTAPNKESAWKRFVDVMTQRFLRGHDGDFDYAAVDDSEEYDDREEEERRRLELYIDDQTPEFVGEGLPGGETGIQDF